MPFFGYHVLCPILTFTRYQVVECPLQQRCHTSTFYHITRNCLFIFSVLCHINPFLIQVIQCSLCALPCTTHYHLKEVYYTLVSICHLNEYLSPLVLICHCQPLPNYSSTVLPGCPISYPCHSYTWVGTAPFCCELEGCMQYVIGGWKGVGGGV